MQPDSSASTCPKPIQRSVSAGSTVTAGRHEREQATHPGMEQQRLLPRDQVLVEPNRRTNELGELVDAVGNLGNACLYQNGTS